MAKVIHKVRKHISVVRKEVFQQMLKLATGSLGLIAALAWNEFIKEVVNEYIKPFVGGSSGVISLAIYAVLVTLLAVFITYSLTKLTKKN